MRVSIERDGICTSHESTEISVITNIERRPCIRLMLDDGGVVGISGTREEVREHFGQLLALAGGETETRVEPVRAEQAAKPERLSAVRIPKTPLKRAGHFKPVKAGQIVKPRGKKKSKP